MQDQHNLKSGSVLQNYTIIRVLGEGGFGITYLATDNDLGLEVVIKEYFPNEFAMRGSDKTITAKTKSMGDFAKGLQRFKEEAQTLAKFSHPSIVKILGYFEANQTAYFVMEYEEGLDLSQYLKQKNAPHGQNEILSIMMPILEGLKEVHKYKYLHRDIKPGNILLRSNNSPVLIDFGASKLVTGDVSKSITSMLTEGYAPLEQYSTDIRKQGPFTDIYAIAAVMYKMITGKVPPSAQTRSYQLLSEGDDPFQSLMSLKLSGYENNFLSAIDRALAINGRDRPQDVQEFQKDIAGLLKREKKPRKETSKILSQPSESKTNNGLAIAVIAFFVIAGGGWFFMQQSKSTTDISEENQNALAAFVDDTMTKKVKRYKNKEEACNNGELKACANLGVAYVQGKGVAQDFLKAVTYFDKACDGSFATGCYNLGQMFYSGKGVTQDHFKAVNYFKRACIDSSARGCNSLGFMYEKGLGTKRNHVSAAKSYQKACELGNTGGCNNLGFMYENGQGVDEDNTKALELYTTSCNADDPIGCVNLGVMYENGYAVVKNKEKALVLYKKGCTEGDQEGCLKHKKLESSI